MLARLFDRLWRLAGVMLNCFWRLMEEIKIKKK